MLLFVSFLGQEMLGVGMMSLVGHMGIIDGAKLEGFSLLNFNASLLEFIESVTAERAGYRTVLVVLLMKSRGVIGFVHVA